MVEIQIAAARILDQVTRGRSLTPLLEEAQRRSHKLAPADRAALQDICYGTLRWYGTLDGVLGVMLKRPLEDNIVRALLVATLYQLHATAAAPYAVVDQAVDAAVRLGHTAARGLVNALLRRFLRERDPLLAAAQRREPALYSHPQWWIDLVRRQYPDRWREVLAEANRHAPLTLRVNRRRTSPADYAERLTASGAAIAWQDDHAIALERAVPIDRLPAFDDGHVSVQDAAAQLAGPLLAAADGMRVLDACAAPGGKTAHLLELADIDLTAIDIDAERLRKVEENLVRLGLRGHVLAADAAAPDAWWDGRPFDRVLLDAPCSASGIARRHPDIKWLRRQDDIASLALTQAAVLEGAWRVLARGGKLLYATCSLFAPENREQVDRFLSAHGDARELPLTVAGLQHGQVMPDRYHDGFFYSLIEKC